MNLIIVTCPKLANARLLKQISQLNEAISVGLLSNIHIICMDDSEARDLINIPYKPDKWENDIADGWLFFKDNIAVILNQGISCLNAYSKALESLTPSSCFPKRKLTESEHSVALRHMLAIEMIAHSKSPCIVLEDDAVVENKLVFLELLKALRESIKPRVFYDLTDGYVPLNLKYAKFYHVGNLQYCPKPIAATRTLMAYAMSPETAQLLFNSLTHYSLPIDMQFQVFLKHLSLPGLSLVNTPFMHGSKNNAMASAVLQE
jgi:hypothetical protein